MTTSGAVPIINFDTRGLQSSVRSMIADTARIARMHSVHIIVLDVFAMLACVLVMVFVANENVYLLVGGMMFLGLGVLIFGLNVINVGSIEDIERRMLDLVEGIFSVTIGPIFTSADMPTYPDAREDNDLDEELRAPTHGWRTFEEVN